MKTVVLTIMISASICATVFAEDLQGYVLRHNWWGTNYYWVHDSNHWGDESNE